MLALIIVLDQFSRVMYRGKKESFAYDMQAGRISMELQERDEFKNDFAKNEKTFAYMPCMHAEDLEMVARCLQGFKELGHTVAFAQDHYDIIAKFGRYPHRNEILERESTKEEEEWVKWNNETKRYGFAIIKKAN
jgi:uncharacterized protein (DUF924 family)